MSNIKHFLLRALLCSLALILSGLAAIAQITITIKNKPVGDVIKEIEKISDYRFFYNQDLAGLDTRVSVDVKNGDIKAIMDQIVRQSSVSYILKANNQVVLSSEPINSQQKKKMVSGSIFDENGDFVIGANVVEKGTTNGTVTDMNGRFSLNVPDKAVLLISYIGYNTQEVPVSGKNQITIKLVEDSKTLDEVVVIGYGTRSKRDVTTAISTMDNKDIAKTLTLNPQMAMQGQMSGVQVSGNLGNPNSRPTIRIRGTNTWGVSDPLYVIDGVPVKEYGAGIEGVGGGADYVKGNINVMSMVDPNDIESISVLKDASSAAIYGVRAANGVVLITTKKGRKERTTVDYSQKNAVQNMNKRLDVMNTREYADHINALYASDPTSIRKDEDYVFLPDNPGYLGNSPTYDWQEAIKNKNAVLQDYSVRISGGDG